ncbi:class I SAM-dependent methyltransferase [Alteriqipengyuania lutimaris]|uniref:Methyltransferase domain-containing protein n=1 Tax=Alteriqipengyuania lutimaris TaxID=1538146 RepID=A0A395LHD2_9SPHN|nr:class I SAM-dependent methyltransferase [Alteriqipengyuania lutimaris]MBB3035490.1 demethylmenaquinone methyltransferase/2-methoxy-6-polyprenyl-1,4-benzoquinol methylase [Alteriqipengyuania lutimaris]RDS76055.1 methyltransferase domain-containing protein [Alteriqipengyuania lutimaris]
MEEADDIYDPAFVRDVFDRCSDKYIAFSYWCSMGFTERWRRQCVAMLDLPPDPCSGYDLMAGTGEAWPHLFDAYPQIDSIHAVDISEGVHRRAIARVGTMRADRIRFCRDDVLASDLPDEGADFVIATFGLKTFNAAQHDKLAALVARLLRPGGRFAFIEASDPRGWPLRPLYNLHLRRVLPVIERTLLQGAHDFAMIGEYTRRFGNCAGFATALRQAGLNAEERSFFYGCATGVHGHKPG